jgi:hypothetical protein
MDVLERTRVIYLRQNLKQDWSLQETHLAND